MIQLTPMKNRCLVYSFGVFASLTSVLALIPPAQAGYVPPPNADAPTSRTTSGGRRGGCQGAGNIDLVALAPQTHVGLTQSTHPTFTWFAPDDIRQPLELELYELNAANRWQSIGSFTLEENEPGIMTFTWPESEPGLTVGKTYRWQVISTCVVGLPSRDLVTTAELQVIEPSTDLPTTSTDPEKQAQQYAEAGLWYDALAAVATSPASQAGLTYRNQLLLDLASVEAETSGDDQTYLSTQLRRIADKE